jgi:hypothetical protein
MQAVQMKEQEFQVVVDGKSVTRKHKVTVFEKPVSFGGFTSGQRISQPVAGRLDSLRKVKSEQRWVVQLDAADFRMTYLTPAQLKAKPVAAKNEAAPVSKGAKKVAKVAATPVAV